MVLEDLKLIGLDEVVADMDEENNDDADMGEDEGEDEEMDGDDEMM